MTAYTCSSPRCGFQAFSLARVELGTCLGRCGERYMRRGDGFFVLQCASVRQLGTLEVPNMRAWATIGSVRRLGLRPSSGGAEGVVGSEPTSKLQILFLSWVNCQISIAKHKQADKENSAPATLNAYTCSSPSRGFQAFSLARVELGTCLGRCGEKNMSA